MDFIKHSNLEGKHAVFSASSSHWLRYSDEKLVDYVVSAQAKEKGTKLHEWAKATIDLGLKQPTDINKTIYMYVNDAIGFKMNTEVVLYYSDLFFGTADAICFRNNVLRIHDLKTGVSKPHMEQLYVYAALFCLEYKVDPCSISFELCLYWDSDIVVDQPSGEDILHIMNRIKYCDNLMVTNNLK